jgi:hypothetical protein
MVNIREAIKLRVVALEGRVTDADLCLEPRYLDPAEERRGDAGR